MEEFEEAFRDSPDILWRMERRRGQPEGLRFLSQTRRCDGAHAFDMCGIADFGVRNMGMRDMEDAWGWKLNVLSAGEYRVSSLKPALRKDGLQR